MMKADPFSLPKALLRRYSTAEFLEPILNENDVCDWRFFDFLRLYHEEPLTIGSEVVHSAERRRLVLTLKQHSRSANLDRFPVFDLHCHHSVRCDRPWYRLEI